MGGEERLYYQKIKFLIDSVHRSITLLTQRIKLAVIAPKICQCSDELIGNLLVEAQSLPLHLDLPRLFHGVAWP